MIDLNRPETWSVVALLIVAVLGFMRGYVIPGVTHDRIVTHLKERYDHQIVALQEDNRLWKQIALRGVQLSESSLEVIKKVKE